MTLSLVDSHLAYDFSNCYVERTKTKSRLHVQDYYKPVYNKKEAHKKHSRYVYNFHQKQRGLFILEAMIL
jgi:hypothetical protein